jgi:hypothetical protein
MHFTLYCSIYSRERDKVTGFYHMILKNWIEHEIVEKKSNMVAKGRFSCQLAMSHQGFFRR